MKIIDDLLATLPDGRVANVNIGLHWTAVVVDVAARTRCGLASTLHDIHVHGVPDIPLAGKLEALSGRELANFMQEDKATMASVGMATINALLPKQPETWVDLNAEEVIAREGEGKSVVLIGHFPFIPRLKHKVGKLTVLELNPHFGDRPVSEAQEFIPSADVVAITSMTLLNNTLDGLLEMVHHKATAIMLGPTTPLSPVLFDYGIDLLCGSVVDNIEPVLRAVRQGANFRQVHRAGVRLVTIANS